MGRARRRCTESRIHPSAWPPGCSTTTTSYGQPGWISRSSRNAEKPSDLTRDDMLDNITLYWLTNTGVSSPRLYWENKGLLRRQGRLHPGSRQHLPWRALSGAAELDGAGLPQPHPLQPARQRRALRGLGTAELLSDEVRAALPVAALDDRVRTCGMPSLGGANGGSIRATRPRRAPHRPT